MYDAITPKLQKQISWGWSRIEDNCWTFAYIKRNSPIMLKKQPSKLYFSLSRFGKVVQFCAESLSDVKSFHLEYRHIRYKIAVFLQNWIINLSIWHRKTDSSSTQSTDILKTPSTLRKWKKVNCPSFSNFGIDTQSWKKAFTAIICQPFWLQYPSLA